jgi:D-alanyl-lipoteichoic acid acyltransferase DltB (MBOAT superfamily)
MLFNSFHFILFFISVLFILFVENAFSKNVVVRNITLLIASYIFYGSFALNFILILGYVTIVNYIAGTALFLKFSDIKRKRIVALAIILSLFPLVLYKYELIRGALLPVGISFFTFQALSYTIDSYRGKIEQKPSLLDFALFVSFFPTVLSGPIEKARNLLPQVRNYFCPSMEDVVQGSCIFIWGVLKKMVIADRLAYYVDWAYSQAQYQSGCTLAIAAIFYSIQIYCDFSGYSDMALGIAKSLGFNVTKNFSQPYFSYTFKEFWHRWHISLTTWFTEYVYFSLGGSRVRTKIRWIGNITTIFILSGIWHGAAWNFLIWGALHALYYLTEYFLGFQNKDIDWCKTRRFITGLFIFIMVTIAWIFFRIASFTEAIYVIRCIFTDFNGDFSMGASSFTFACTLFMLIIFAVFELLVSKRKLCFDTQLFEKKMSANLISIVLMLLLIAMFGMSSDNFVYFQF